MPRSSRTTAEAASRDLGSAPRPKAATHVGLIGHSPVLTKEQRAELGRILIGISRSGPNNLILHHGCRPGSDEAAHLIASNHSLWRIHGHPATDGSPEPSLRMMDDVDRLHEGKPQAERDAAIASVSRFLIAIPPYLVNGSPNARLVTSSPLTVAEVAGKEIVYLPQSELPQAPGSRTGERGRRTPGSKLVTERKDATWAARQGEQDRHEGTCRQTYKAFLRDYGLARSDQTLRMWDAYRSPARQERNRKPDGRRRTELVNAGAEAKADPDGVVTFRVAGSIEEQFLHPKGQSAAAAYAADFNGLVLTRKLNPPETIRDAVR